MQVFDPTTGDKLRRISQRDLAAWLVAQLDDATSVHHSITIATS